MDADKFIRYYKEHKKQTLVSEEIIDSNGSVQCKEIVLKEGDGKHYRTTLYVSTTDSTDITAPFPVVEVVPVEVTKTIYKDVVTISDTKDDLLDRVTQAISCQIDHLYRDVSEPYRGSIEEYKRITEEEIDYIASEVLVDLLGDYVTGDYRKDE